MIPCSAISPNLTQALISCLILRWKGTEIMKIIEVSEIVIELLNFF